MTYQFLSSQRKEPSWMKFIMSSQLTSFSLLKNYNWIKNIFESVQKETIKQPENVWLKMIQPKVRYWTRYQLTDSLTILQLDSRPKLAWLFVPQWTGRNPLYVVAKLEFWYTSKYNIKDYCPYLYIDTYLHRWVRIRKSTGFGSNPVFELFLDVW